MKKFLILSIASLLALGSCGKKTEEGNTTNVQNTTDANALPADLKLNWRFSPTQDTDVVITNLEVTYNGKVVYKDNMQGEANEIPKDQFGEYKIPADALLACSGFWAGFQNVMYIKKEDNSKLGVYAGGIGEEGGEYTYTKRKDITAAELK